MKSTAALFLVPLLLTACTTGTTPAAAPLPATTPATAPKPTPAPTPPKLYDIKFPNTHQQLLGVLPTEYHGHKLTVYSDLDGGGGSPRDDPFEGHRVEPEVCRLAVWVGGQPGNTYAKWPYLPTAHAYPADDKVSLSFQLVSLPAVWGEKYMNLQPLAAPQCTHIRIDGTESASIVERSVSGLGTRSRYVLRTYSVDGAVHREAYVSFFTPTYVVKIRSTSPTFNEKNLIAFARQIQVVADSKLGR